MSIGDVPVKQRMGLGMWIPPFLAFVLLVAFTVNSWPKTNPEDIPTGVYPATHGEAFVSVAYSPDGASVACGGSDGKIVIRDAVSGAVRQSLVYSNETRREVGPLLFSDDGKTIVASEIKLNAWYPHLRSSNPNVKAWDLASGELISEFRGVRRAYQARLLADGRTLAMLGSEIDKEERFAKFDTGGKPVGTPRDFPASLIGGEVNFGAISSDGKKIALAGFQCPKIAILDAESCGTIHLLPGRNVTPPGDYPTSLEFSPDGKTLAVIRFRSIEFRDVASGQINSKTELGPEFDYILSVAFSADGTRLAAGGYQVERGWLARNLGGFSMFGLSWHELTTRVLVVETKTARKLKTFSRLKFGLSDISLSPDGRSVAAVGNPQSSAVSELVLWSIPD